MLAATRGPVFFGQCPRSPSTAVGFPTVSLLGWCEWRTVFSRGCMCRKLLWVLRAEVAEKTEEGGLTLAGSCRVHECTALASVFAYNTISRRVLRNVVDGGRNTWKNCGIWKNLENKSFQGMYWKKLLPVETENCNPEILAAREFVPQLLLEVCPGSGSVCTRLLFEVKI